MNQGFALFEKQLLALHYNGSYITNFEFRDIAQKIGLDLDLADREKMLKNLLKMAVQEHKEAELIQEMTKLLNSRIEEYRNLANMHPECSNVLSDYIQKTRSTIMLLQHRLRMNPYG